LLEELFTRDGCGTMITLEHYDSLHDATMDDVAGILTLIHPLEMEGLLVPRTQQQLERQVHDFVVMERDGTIIGCAALNEIPVDDGEKAAELACMAVHPDYRNDKRGTALLLAIEERAAKRGITRLFALTTRAIHWFQEHGFRLVEPEDLPPARRETYNLQRNSRVLLKHLS
jgi:amino-acid N-acetyltransferase